jgi:hypothetical protein
LQYDKRQPYKDFVYRTVLIAKELKEHKYSTTLQINLLFGAVIFSKACWYKKWSRVSLKKGDLSGVFIDYPDDRVSLQVILHCLRNGLTHWQDRGKKNVEFEHSPSGEIIKVAISGGGLVNGSYEKVKISFDLESNGIFTFMKKIEEAIQEF